MDSPRSILILFLLMSLGVLSFLHYPKQRQQAMKSQNLAKVLSASAADASPLGVRIKAAGCVVQGPLPDSGCTPGAIFPDVTIEKICVHGYTKTVRNVSTKLRQNVFAEYGISYPQPTGSYEVDHLIPLALGG